MRMKQIIGRAATLALVTGCTGAGSENGALTATRSITARRGRQMR
jgi:hypothetical protein